ncbi:MAG: hypothetical protein A7316_09445 [Candidatus Altiarchaeales archaeon WOR_SM1_86-2]|nr:MAG: hypothetical protein A7316_09445 [Candidatus Altiarchaeales archaeon WOR_SM1_86-2]
MSIDVHFLNVGQGNMVVIIFPDQKVMVYDCNITEENEENVFAYLQKIMPKNEIDVFVNSHREADHMGGIKELHKKYNIKQLWDSGVSGNTDTPEYQEYMDFRRNVGYLEEVKPNRYWAIKPNVKILNGKREGLDDPNAQSIVIHINNKGSSVLLTGDTDAKVWKDYIMLESYRPAFGVYSNLKSSILLASHHGSISFFGDPKSPYTKHISTINPDITIISVGEKNSYNHPDDDAIKLYKEYSEGAINNGEKIFRTDVMGNIKAELKDDGNCYLSRINNL